MSQRYAIGTTQEADASLGHPDLGDRYRRLVVAVWDQVVEGDPTIRELCRCRSKPASRPCRCDLAASHCDGSVRDVQRGFARSERGVPSSRTVSCGVDVGLRSLAALAREQRVALIPRGWQARVLPVNSQCLIKSIAEHDLNATDVFVQRSAHERVPLVELQRADEISTRHEAARRTTRCMHNTT